MNFLKNLFETVPSDDSYYYYQSPLVHFLRSFWIPGFMPVQLLFVFLFFFIGYGLLNLYLTQIGKRIQALWQGVILWIVSFVILKYLVFPPIPKALFSTYLGLITLAIFLYISSQDQLWEEFKAPILATLSAKSPIYAKVQITLFVIVPIITWTLVTYVMVPRYRTPIELRTVGPAPPASIQVHGTEIVLQKVKSPFRVDEKGNYFEGIEEKYLNANLYDDKGIPYVKYLMEGGEIYFHECHFCHGANLDGNGIYTYTLNPLAANFTDPGTIAQLQENYVLWRLTKGGIGMPREGFPWASSMPAYEKHISTNDIWKVIEFIYWETGYYPRVWN